MRRAGMLLVNVSAAGFFPSEEWGFREECFFGFNSSYFVTIQVLLISRNY